MKYRILLRWISSIILRYYLAPFSAWLTLREVVYTDNGLPMYLRVRWRYYRPVFPWFIQAALPRTHRVTSIDTITEYDDGGGLYDVELWYDVNQSLY